LLCGVEAMDYSYALMNLTVYGRQELWEDSPPGWPQQWQPDAPPSGSTDARSPSGRDSKLDALTTSALPGGRNCYRSNAYEQPSSCRS
jgi:hypothetical protein